MRTRIAAIDIGTVTARLLVADVTEQGLVELAKRAEIVNLGEGVDATGVLSEAAMERTCAAVASYMDVVRGFEEPGAPVTVGSDSGSGEIVDDVTVPVTDANGQTAAQQPTNAEGQTLDLNSGGKKEGGKSEGTTVPQLEHASTVAYNGQISQGKANLLLRMLDGIENPFEEDLVEDRYAEGKESIKVYIANVHEVQKQIMADPEMYTFVTKSNIEYWNLYLTQMERKYGEFASIVGALKPGEKPGSAVYTSYVAFQDEYRKALEVYYSIYDAAEQYAK